MIGDNIKKYRLLNNMSLRELGNKLSLSQTAIAKYEKNELVPDGEKLLKFCDVLKCKVYDLLKPESEYKDINLKFKLQKKFPNNKLELLKQLVKDKVLVYLEVLELNSTPSILLKKYKVDSLEDASLAAANFRSDNNINTFLPLINLCNIIENLGMNIVFINNDNDIFNGFNGASECLEGKPMICILNNSNVFIQRFTLAHELGHLILDINPSLDSELICDEFASSLLLPKEAIIRKFGSSRKYISDIEYILIREEYQVSIKTIMNRLHRYNIISDSAYKYAYIHYNKFLKDEEQEIGKLTQEKALKYKILVHRLRSQELIT